jgi:hypothetical protein
MLLLSLILCSGVFAPAQDQAIFIQGPVVGFVPDHAGEMIRPILGIPAAPVLGEPLGFGNAVRNAAISPGQDYAIALTREDNIAVLIRFTADPVAVSSLEGVRPGMDMIAISQTGAAAAVYDHEAKILQAIGRVAAAPEIVFEFDANGIPGHLQDIAVSDDAALVLLRFSDAENATLWLVGSNGLRWSVPANRPSAGRFLANRHDAIIADDVSQDVFLLTHIDETASRMSVASAGDGFDAISGVAASEDGKRIFITSTASRNVTAVNLETGISFAVPCYCRATGLHRLKGNVFVLATGADGGVALLDASSSEPRVVIIPPAAEIVQ